MSIHVCPQCGSRFEYCRACVFRPVRYKDAGFCSKECYEASKKPVVEPKVIEEPVVVEEILEAVAPIEEAPIEAEVKVEPKVEIKAEPKFEAPIVEAINKETNTYKNKKKKYSVHE